MSADAFTPITTETKLSLPLNGSIFTTTRAVSPEKPTPTIGASMESELGPAWKDSLIIATNIVPVENKERQQIVHARIPREADQLASNWEYSTCSIGGRNFPSVQRTVILVAKADLVPATVTMDVVAYNSPAIGSAMPVETDSIFTGQGYILADRQIARSGMQLEPVFRVERRNYIIRSARKTIGIDPLNGKPLWSETTLYYTGETVPTYGGTVDALFADEDNSYWGTQSDGTRRTGSRLSCAWYAITTELVIAGTFSAGVVTIDSYDTQQRYFWPPVLNDIEFLNWARRDGGVDIFPRFTMLPDGYNGPCDVTITRTWKQTPFTDILLEQLQPTPVHYSSPFFSLNIPSSLHPAVTCICDIGTGDPVYEQNVGSSRTVAATDPTAWPDTLRAYDSQGPFRGGFLRTVQIISKPEA